MVVSERYRAGYCDCEKLAYARTDIVIIKFASVEKSVAGHADGGRGERGVFR